jgi:hypothetical protein
MSNSRRRIHIDGNVVVELPRSKTFLFRKSRGSSSIHLLETDELARIIGNLC